MIKNKVFGAGYPSLPTVSLEEFYEQEAARIQQELERQKCVCVCVPHICYGAVRLYLGSYVGTILASTSEDLSGVDLEG